MNDLQARVQDAVRQFWRTRLRQKKNQETSGRRDQGSRGAVTGGGQLDGFIGLVSTLLMEHGVPEGSIFRKRRVELPGFFRPTKEWDLLVMVNGNLLATMKFKSQVGPSFGNNFNNCTEEALGSATDLWTAYREGAFLESPQPWLGYFIFLEEAPGSTRPVQVQEPHFKVFEEFRETSYARRYELFCHKLVRERFYDAACLILSEPKRGIKGAYREPSAELAFSGFVASVIGKTQAFLKIRGR
jgi:hypothetical protein